MLAKGKLTYLRTFWRSDLDLLYNHLCNIESYGQYFPIYITSESQLKRDFEQSGFWSEQNGEILICDLSDHMLGMMYFFKTAPYTDGYEIGYRLFDIAQSGKGLMTEALMLCTYVLFSVWEINRLQLKIEPHNFASRRVAQKCGYSLEGLARGTLKLRDVYHDLEVYSILRSEAPVTQDDALPPAEVIAAVQSLPVVG
jgi:RimJ/RimL family protein N-acetyltransferase